MTGARRDIHRVAVKLLHLLADIGCCRAAVVAQVASFLLPVLYQPHGCDGVVRRMAVHAGACARALDSPPPHGVLLGTRQYHCDDPYFILGSTYQVSCQKLISNLDGMCSFECQIFLNKLVIAEARISVLQNTSGDAFNE